MTKADLYRLIDELPDDAVAGTAAFLEQVVRGGIHPEQAWFWTPAWQEGEREAEADIAAGRFERFESDDAFLAHLENVPPASPSAAPLPTGTDTFLFTDVEGSTQLLNASPDACSRVGGDRRAPSEGGAVLLGQARRER